MNFFSWFSNSKDVKNDITTNLLADHEKETESMRRKRLTYRELVSATQNFKNLIGEGNLGCVYKGRLKSGKVVAVKHLKDKVQEFDPDVLMLSHPNLVNLIDYFTEGDQRFLVSEYMPMGSLQNHLFDLNPKQKPLNWDTRLKIAIGVACGLEYLHHKTNPPVMYRNMKLSNILLDDDFNPKLSDVGLHLLEHDINHCIVFKDTVVYCPKEYVVAGRKWTSKSDIYGFGVVLLELITGLRALDNTRKEGEKVLVHWCMSLFEDNKTFQLVDPRLQGQVSARSLHRVVTLAAMCLRESPLRRPSIDKILDALLKT